MTSTPTSSGAVWALLIVSVLCAASQGQDCRPLEASTQARVTRYVATRLRAPKGATIKLKDSQLLPGSCIRHLTYSVNWPPRTLALFLSPDERYISDQMIDLTAPSSVGPGVLATMPNMEAAKLERDAPSRGAANAPVTIIEFSDFECPFCEQLTKTLNDKILPGNPSVRVVFKYFPLSFHPWAEKAAEIAECAHKQNNDVFWQVHDYIFSQQKNLNVENVQEKLVAFLRTAPHIDQNALGTCVTKRQTRQDILRNVEEGQKLGVQGTPTFFINGMPMVGIKPAAALESAIASAKRNHAQSD